MAESGQYSLAGYEDQQTRHAVPRTAGPGPSAGGGPARRIASGPLTELLSDQERMVIDAMNQTQTNYPRLSSLGELFAEHVASRAEAPAVTYGPTTLTYRQLDAVTNALAARLAGLGVRPGVLVAIHADRDLSVVVGMLAAIKAGGAYLPLEPTHPAMRLRKIVAEAQPAVLLTRSAADDPLELGLPVVAVAPYLHAEPPEPARRDLPPGGGAKPGDLAYVMYTSGSSGQPKGTCVTHRNVVRLVRNTDYAQFRPGDRIAQISNAAFDAATFEVWGALLNGGHLIGIERGTILSPSLLATALKESGIDTMVMATPLFNQLAAEDPAIFASLSQLLVGGDVMGVSQARSVAENLACTLVNGYGPTECTTFATAHRVTAVPADQARVPIGRPIANTTCYVLDDALRLQAPGVAGQLYVGGDGVGRGYLGQPGLTAGRFVPDPFAAEPGARMYATGDLVHLLPDGSFEFLGRADSQVKIRGFRIELGEIDAALLEHPAIAEAVTIPSDNQYGDKSLVSYYAAARGQAPGPAEVARFLGRRLPEYMVPGHLIQLDEMPKNANMKIERRRLPAPPAAVWENVNSPVPVCGLAAGVDLVEDEVAAIIGRLLSVPRFGLAENFFESGGHSLLATRLLAEVRQRFRAHMPLSELFDDPTPRGIAAYIRQHAESPLPELSPGAHD